MEIFGIRANMQSLYNGMNGKWFGMRPNYAMIRDEIMFILLYCH